MRQDERRARTRQRLLDAAVEVFGRLGFHAATVDDVAAAAGHTKGAVYAHFASKEELFLALLDHHVDDQVAQVDQLLDPGSGGDLRAGLADAAARQRARGGSRFGLLMLEFWLYAARDDQARAALAARHRRLRQRLATAIAERDRARGVADDRAAQQAATLVLALDAGLFLQQLLDPRSVPADLRTEALAAVIDAATGAERRG